MTLNATATTTSETIVKENENSNDSSDGTIQVTFARNNYLEVEYY